MPALLTRTSTPPNRASACESTSIQAGSEDTSCAIAGASPPAPSISPAVSWAAFSSRSVATTWAPLAEKRSAIARPISPPAPVMSQTRFVMCGSPEYLAASGTPKHPDDLHRHTIVGYVAPDTAVRFNHRFLIDGTTRTTTFPSRLTVDDGEALVAAGLRSAGLVMANDYLMEQHIADGGLVRVLRGFEIPPAPISVVQLPTRNPSPAARAFVAMLRRRLATTLQEAGDDRS